MTAPDPLRWRWAVPLALLLALPFAFVSIPPLTDVPGHIGRFAVQTAPAGDPLWRLFGFHWTLTLNLASDAVVQLLHPLGIVPVVWMLCAATPVLTALGVVAIARVCNPRGTAALPWALLFVWNFPFLWGFLNFALTAAFALIAFAAWVALASRSRWRAALFLIVTPLLLIGHGVAGVTAVGLIVGHATGHLRDWRSALHRLIQTWPPVVATVLTLIVWKAVGAGDGGPTVWLPYRKVEAVVEMLRDQNAVLDIGSVIACALVWGLGQYWGARTRAVGPLFVLIALFVLAPSLLSGSDRIDTRLAPPIAMVAFAVQDWSAVAPRWRRVAILAGWTLLAVRLGVTTVSFAGYGERYAHELTALDHLPRGARVLTLTEVTCGWRSHRVEHLANLATLYRGAWVNSHWAIGGVQLLAVRFRPSPDYAADPSQLVWPEACVDRRLSAAVQDRRTVAETLPLLPLDRVDYLWLVDARLPAGHADAHLRPVWRSDVSALYAVRTAPSP